jgi:hypothetical protein
VVAQNVLLSTSASQEVRIIGMGSEHGLKKFVPGCQQLVVNTISLGLTIKKSNLEVQLKETFIHRAIVEKINLKLWSHVCDLLIS